MLYQEGHETMVWFTKWQCVWKKDHNVLIIYWAVDSLMLCLTAFIVTSDLSLSLFHKEDMNSAVRQMMTNKLFPCLQTRNII